MPQTTLDPGSDSQALGRTANQVESRARALAKDVLRWLQLVAREETAQIVRRVELAKADDPFRASLNAAKGQSLEDQLRGILRSYGVRQMQESSRRSTIAVASAFSIPRRLRSLIDKRARRPESVRLTPLLDKMPDNLNSTERNIVRDVLSQTPPPTSAQAIPEIRRRLSRAALGEVIIRPTVVADFMQRKEPLIQQLLASSRAAVRKSAGRIISDALLEEPKPSAGEIARRIMRTVHGPKGAGGQVLDREKIGYGTGKNTTVLRTDLLHTDSGVLYEFSAERAALIARTELAQAENTGIATGYARSGATHLKWLAKDDQRSGDRHHEDMHGKTVAIGEWFYNGATGNYLRYPGDPQAKGPDPIKDLANCRCTVRAVRK